MEPGPAQLTIMAAIAVFWLLPMIPIAVILRKAGFSPWWTLVYLLPFGNLVGLFVFAFARWPERE